MEDFKVGDRVKIVDDGRVSPYADERAKDLKLTKYKKGYGKWPYAGKSGDGVGNGKEGVILSIGSPYYRKRKIAGVEIDNENVQIVIEVEGLELVKRASEKPLVEPVQDLSSPFPTLREFLGV